jgi:Cu(I)/Ag(I) efflux system membrane fusion protein
MEHSMRRVFSATIIAITTSLTSAAFAADTMGMKGPAPMAMSMGYHFELAGPVQSAAGKSIVLVRLIHATDKKPVVGAVIIQSRADMAPIGMAMMNAPIKALPVTTPGVYPFEIQNGSVWKKADKWSLTFSAKVQGEMATVHGSIITELKP